MNWVLLEERDGYDTMRYFRVVTTRVSDYYCPILLQLSSPTASAAADAAAGPLGRFGCCYLDVRGDRSFTAPTNFNLFDHHSESKYFRQACRPRQWYAGRGCSSEAVVIGTVDASSGNLNVHCRSRLANKSCLLANQILKKYKRGPGYKNWLFL